MISRVLLRRRENVKGLVGGVEGEESWGGKMVVWRGLFCGKVLVI
jgi:hypothetical protein